MAEFLNCVRIPQRFLVYGMLAVASMICQMDRQAYFETIYTVVYVPTYEEDSKSDCPAMYNKGKSHGALSDFMVSLMSKRCGLFVSTIFVVDLFFGYLQTNVAPDFKSQVCNSVRFRRCIKKKFSYFVDHEHMRALTQVFYVAFVISSIPAGCVADHYGGRWVITAGVFMGSLTTLTYPFFGLQGPVRLLLARLIQGFGQGMVISSAHAIMAQWTPKSERARCITIVAAGQFAGWGLGYVLPIISRKFMDLWQIPFYVTGGVGLLWVLVWLHFCRSKPSQSVYITETELQYILSHREGIDDQILSKRLNVPWKAVLTSPPVWSLVLVNWAFCWVHFPTIHQLKFYAVNVLRITEDLSGSAATFAETVTAGTSAIFWGIVGDYLVNNNYMSRTVNRKLFGVACNLLIAPFLLAIPLAGCSALTVFSIYDVIRFIYGLHISSVGVNPLDLSPRHAGMISALLNTSGYFAAIFSWEFVLSMGMPSDISRWWILYIWMSAQLVTLSLPYIWYGSGEMQPWNYPARRSRRTQPSHSEMSIPLPILQ